MDNGITFDTSLLSSTKLSQVYGLTPSAQETNQNTVQQPEAVSSESQGIGVEVDISAEAYSRAANLKDEGSNVQSSLDSQAIKQSEIAVTGNQQSEEVEATVSATTQTASEEVSAETQTQTQAAAEEVSAATQTQTQTQTTAEEVSAATQTQTQTAYEEVSAVTQTETQTKPTPEVVSATTQTQTQTQTDVETEAVNRQKDEELKPPVVESGNTTTAAFSTNSMEIGGRVEATATSEENMSSAALTENVQDNANTFSIRTPFDIAQQAYQAIPGQMTESISSLMLTI